MSGPTPGSGRQGADRRPRARGGPVALLALLLPALMATPGCSPPEPEADVVAEEGVPDMPAGYEVRLDSERSDPGEFLLRDATREGSALRVTTGPAGIAWRAADAARRNPFRARASFVQHGSPTGYREAYGIFVGGLDLTSPDLEYTYLLVRGTGDYLVKRRRGETTETLVDWTPHSAVSQVEQEGDTPRNVLAVEAGEEETLFLVNDVVVHRMPTPEARPHGVAGIRVNHRLDVEVEEWSVEPLPEEPEEPTTS